MTLVTAVPPGALYGSREKIQWLAEHLPCVDPIHDLIFTHAKQKVIGDLLFDDRPSTLEAFDGISACMAWPYNKGAGTFRTPEGLDFPERWRWFEGACGTLFDMFQAYEVLSHDTRADLWDLTQQGTQNV